MNPLLPSQYYIPDVEARVDQDGTIYLYGSKDIVNDDDYCSNEYQVFYSKDMIHWKERDISFSTEQMQEKTDIRLYAPDCIKKDGKYLIARQHSKDFSEDWELVGILPIGAALSRVIKPEDAIANITDWKFKNGNPKYTIVDKDHGTKRIWGGTSNGVRRGINSFAKADDHTFEMITENKNKTELDTMLEKLNSKGIKLRDLI